MKHKQDMTPEMEKKLNACKSAEDVRRLTEAEDIELRLDDLETVSGGDLEFTVDYVKYTLKGWSVVTRNGKKYFLSPLGFLEECWIERDEFCAVTIFPDGTWKVDYWDLTQCWY